MRFRTQLNSNHTSEVVNLSSFDAVAVTVTNLTGSPICIRIGANEIPGIRNADIIIPAASEATHPARGTMFGVGFADATLVDAPADNVISGLSGVANVEFHGQGEIIPNLGSVSFQSLSMSEFTNGLQAFTAGTLGPYDLAAWGGLNVLVIAGAASGQGICTVQVSSDLTTWKDYGSWAFWPGIPLGLAIPRTARYVRVVLASAGIAGDAAISGVVVARASLAELQQLAVTPGTTSLAKVVTVASLGTGAYIFASVGLNSITVRLNFSVGVRAELVVYTGPSAAGPWSFVTFREQQVSGFYNSITRTIGQLDAYLKLEVLDIATGGVAGTLNLSVQGETDLSAYLQNIYSALGDIGQPVNVGQSIYHQLALINQNTDTLESLITTVNSWLQSIYSNTDTLEALITASNVQLAAINTNTDTIEALIAASNTQLVAINTNLSTLIAQANNPVTVVHIQFTATVAGVWQRWGIGFNALYIITSAKVNYQMRGSLDSTFVYQLGYGTAGAVVFGFYGGGGQQPEGNEGVMLYGGPKAGGIPLPAGSTDIWVFSSVAGVTFNASIASRAP